MNKVAKYMFLVALVTGAMLMGSCADSEYPELWYVPDNQQSQNEETMGAVAITPSLNCATLFYASASRGNGAFDHNKYLMDYEAHLMSSKFYLLAYRRNTATGEMADSVDMTQLMNYNTNPDRRECLLSTEKFTVSNTEHRGKLTMPVDYTGALKFLDDETASKEQSIFWSKPYGKTGYDFFAYYTDDAVIENVTALQDRTIMDVVFDGTQDLMVGAAKDLTAEVLAREFPGVREQLTKDNILAYGEGAYSEYSASHSVQPRIDMKHCLARVIVSAVQKDADALVDISGLRIWGRTKGSMTVAARNKSRIGFTPKGDYSWILFPDYSNQLLYDNETSLGPGVLLPAEEKYKIEVDFVERTPLNDDMTEWETKNNTISFDVTLDNDTFHAGTAYYVKLNVYGATKIDVEVFNGETWKDGGTVNIGMQE